MSMRNQIGSGLGIRCEEALDSVFGVGQALLASVYVAGGST